MVSNESGARQLSYAASFIKISLLDWTNCTYCSISTSAVEKIKRTFGYSCARELKVSLKEKALLGKM